MRPASFEGRLIELSTDQCEPFVDQPGVPLSKAPACSRRRQLTHLYPDVITAINGRSFSSPSAITALILTKKPGAKITVTYTDRYGTSHVTTVTLGSGPPQ